MNNFPLASLSLYKARATQRLTPPIEVLTAILIEDVNVQVQFLDRKLYITKNQGNPLLITETNYLNNRLAKYMDKQCVYLTLFRM